MERAYVIVTSGLVSFFTIMFGTWDLPVQIFLTAIVLDYLTGLVKAGIKKEVNSSVGINGILKKVMYIGVGMVANIADLMMGGSGAIRCIVLNLISANELVSIIENAGECGVPIPNKLKNIILKLKEQDDKGGNSRPVGKKSKKA